MNARLLDLVNQLPDADNRGMLTTDIDKERIDKTIAALASLGTEAVLGLIDLLDEPGSAADVKPRYALRCLANHLLTIKDEAARARFCQTLAGQLGGDRPEHVQAFLCQELGWAGRGEALPALGKLLTDPKLGAPAAMALVAIRAGVGGEFRAAWPKAQGESRRHVMDALAELAEPESAPLFVAGLRDDDREVRVAAAAGLASLGAAESADILLKAADEAGGWERVQAAKHCLVLAEKRAAAGDKATARRVYERLRTTRVEKSEQHVRQAAERGLAALG